MRTLTIILPALLGSIGCAWAAAHGGGSAGVSTLPAISSVLPNGGGTAGGTVAAIAGVNFAGATAVKFGPTPATSYTVNSATSITATAPAGASTIDVTVTTPSGTSVVSSADKFSYADWQASYQGNYASQTDRNGIHMGGTELRSLVSHLVPVGDPLPAGQGTCTTTTAEYDSVNVGCPVVWAGVGYWIDSGCTSTSSSPPTTQQPQILALITPTGLWNQDAQLPGVSGSPTGSNCSSTNTGLFDVITSLFEFTFSYDGSGAAISPPIKILVGSGATVAVEARNDNTGAWIKYTGPTGAGYARAMLEVLDTSAGIGNYQDYLLLGNDTTTVHQATFTAWPTGFNISATSVGEPWSQDGVTAGTCTNIFTCTNLDADWQGSFTGSISGTTLTITAVPSYANLLAVGDVLTWSTQSATITALGTGTGGIGNYTVTTTATTGTTTLTRSVASYLNTCASSSRLIPCFMVDTTHERIMAMVNCNGKHYLTVGFEIWQRQDATSSSWWKRFASVPAAMIQNNPNNPSANSNSQSGMRGLHCSPYNGGFALVAATEGTGDVWRFDTTTGVATVETNLLTDYTNLSGTNEFYGIHAYNNMIDVNNSVLFGEGEMFGVPPGHTYEATPSHVITDTGMWVRCTSTSTPAGACSGTSTNPTYALAGGLSGTLNAIKQIAAQVPQPPAGPCSPGPKCPIMISTRATVLSPFPTDAKQYIYFGGVDGAATFVTNTAWVLRVPLSTLGGIP